jgi:hypothetical protein
VVRRGSLHLLIVVELRRQYYHLANRQRVDDYINQQEAKVEAFKKELEEDPEYQSWRADLPKSRKNSPTITVISDGLVGDEFRFFPAPPGR